LELVEGENLSIEPNLIGTNLSEANLVQADLSRAELSELDRGALLTSEISSSTYFGHREGIFRSQVGYPRRPMPCSILLR
jgi:hypothetical protein